MDTNGQLVSDLSKVFLHVYVFLWVKVYAGHLL